MYTATEMNSQKMATAGSALGSAVQPSATQYDQLCMRISNKIDQTESEVVMLRNTLSAVMPQSDDPVKGEAESKGPPEHSAPIMCFMRHIEQRLSSMQQQLEYIRVRTPF